MGLLTWKWNNAATRMLPRAALNIGVTMTAIASTPTKNTGNDHAVYFVPLSSQAGACQIPHRAPRISDAVNGVWRRCSNGRASAGHPDCFTGPNTTAKAQDP